MAQTEDSFFLLGMTIVKGQSQTLSKLDMTRENLRQFRSFFGCSPAVLLKCWLLLEQHNISNSYQKYGLPLRAIHLLWAAMFLKTYAKEAHHASLANTNARTYRDKVWATISAIADLVPFVVSLL